MIQRGTRHPPLPPVTHSPTMPPSLPPDPQLPAPPQLPPRLPGAAVTPSPSTGLPCSACLVPMVALAGVAGFFVVISAVLGERFFRGAWIREVPSTWRRGGELWIEPEAPAQPDGPSKVQAGEMWIPRPVPGTDDWYRGPAGSSGSGNSSGIHSAAPGSTGSTVALWDSEEPAWGAQPHVTLQDISEFFRRGGGGLGRGL
ncbi:transmembrane protein C16orf54 homolog [Emydura macquarii macquarii]|uniref:transmembrane protein C16orf54 homolog n=1 Tax=Emydura macquarii macquarii TaxID=1129001 RepID=UPI00352BAD9A